MIISDYKKSLDLFYKYSGIPAFIIDEEGEILFSTFGAKNGNKIPVVSYLLKVETSGNAPQLVVFNGLELYGIIEFAEGKQNIKIILGPVLSIKPTAIKNFNLLSFSGYFPEDKIRRFIKNIPLLGIPKFVHFLELIFHSLTGLVSRFDDIADKRIMIDAVPDALKINVPDISFDNDYANVETHVQDVDKMYELVKSGNVMETEKLFVSSFLVRSRISQSNKENYTMFVASAAFFGKAALDAGIPFNEVHSIGFTFIKYAETIESPLDYFSLLQRMIVGYATRVQEENTRRQHPQSIKKAIDYIEQNLHYPLALEDVAKNVKLSRAYFSQLFSTQMGISLQSYINRRKVQEAEQLLKYTSMSIKEISEVLAFCSQSYFTEVFKTVMKTTPVAFRKHTRDEK
ncbi:MAG: AraC family transcriptional regulator [Candidatus Izemoplasmatales bacterium]|nr:AraC family transcriptional regulator [Candidatus Izemoplasmatales bacterium]